MKIPRAIIGVDSRLIAVCVAKESDRATVFVIHAAIHGKNQRLALLVQFALQRIELEKGRSTGITVKQANVVLGNAIRTDAIDIALML